MTTVADGAFHPVVTDPVGDGAAALSVGETDAGLDIVGVDAAIDQTNLKIRVRFAGWPVEDKLVTDLSQLGGAGSTATSVAVLMFTNLNAYYAAPLNPPSPYPEGSIQLSGWPGAEQVIQDTTFLLHTAVPVPSDDSATKSFTFTIPRQSINVDFAANRGKGISLTVLAGSDFTSDVDLQTSATVK